MPDKDPLKGQESVQLFQEHAARSTQSLPFKMAPSTLYALGVFVFLAAIGLSIRVGSIRGELEQQRVENIEQESDIPEAVLQELFSEKPESEEADTTSAESTVADLLAQWRERQREAFEQNAPGLIEKLHGDDQALRTQASLQLRESDEGFPILVDALKSDNVQARRAAANALSLSQNAPAELVGPALIEALLTDRDPYVREYAATGVGRFRTPGTIEALNRAISDPDPSLRQSALTGLMYINDMITFPIFARALQEDDRLTNRYVAATAIARLAYDRRRDHVSDEWAEGIMAAANTMLRSLDERIRARGCQVAGYFRLKAMTPRLISLLGDPNEIDEVTGAGAGADLSWEVRARAGEAIGYAYEGQAASKNEDLAHIVNALVLAEAFDPEPAVRWKVSEALLRTGYDPNDWGKLEMLETAPREALEGRDALQYHGTDTD
ncbi:MAG: HEAT repeat domain-containing protein [Armatimonadetes bacterium]|nr:HEAT repeat domain-containing protein [Armatimonadota bacterium]